jgi:hypothetical protein
VGLLESGVSFASRSAVFTLRVGAKSSPSPERNPPHVEAQEHLHLLRPAEVEEVDGIPVVIPERAILDGIADGIDPRLLDQAIATARRRGDIGLGTEEALRETLGRGAVRAARRQPPA